MFDTKGRKDFTYELDSYMLAEDEI